MAKNQIQVIGCVCVRVFSSWRRNSLTRVSLCLSSQFLFHFSAKCVCLFVMCDLHRDLFALKVVSVEWKKIASSFL